MSLTKICSSLNFCGVVIAIGCVDVDAAVAIADDCVDVDAATAFAVAVVVAVDCVVLNVVIAV